MSKSYISKEEVILLAKSSEIELNEQQIQEYVSSLNNVFEVMQEALSVETSDLSSEIVTEHVITPEDLREDIVIETMPREEFLRNVPESLGGLVKVPTVIS